jgi:hypothetical protein
MLAYLRYNIGEFNYLRFLSRFAAKLGHFRSVAIQKKLGLAPSFVTALTKVSWSKADAETARSLLESVNFLASNTNLFVTYGWSNLGFIDALAAQGPVCLEPYSPQPWMSEAADIALNVLTLYADRGLFDLLELFVTSHPVRLQAGGDVNLVGFKPVKSIKPIRNAFSFERIRRAYAQASKDAGLEE